MKQGVAQEVISGIYIQEVNATQLKKINCTVPMQVVLNPDGSESYICNGPYTLVLVSTPPVDPSDPIQPAGCGNGNTCGPRDDKSSSTGGKLWTCKNSNNLVCSSRKVQSDSTVIIILKDSL